MSSRWLEVPGHVTENPGDLPRGFRAAGVAAGIKPSGGMDVGLLVCSEPDCVSATRFTRSGVLAAPVVLTKERARQDAIRVVIVNSGNANAATGNRGFEQAARTQGAAAMAGGVREDQVAVASTGVIGVQLDAGDIIRGHRAGARGPARVRPRRLLRGDPDHGQVPQGGRGRRRAAVRHGAADGAGQGRGDDLPELRDDAVLRADGREAGRGRSPTCCSGCAWSARSIASPWTGSSPPTTR